MGNARLSGTDLHADIGVENLAFAKTVGIVYSTDDWATVQTAFATYANTMKSGLEIWEVVVAPVGPASQVELAVFYRVQGNDYWDNNFWRTYSVTSTQNAQWGVPFREPEPPNAGLPYHSALMEEGTW